MQKCKCKKKVVRASGENVGLSLTDVSRLKSKKAYTVCSLIKLKLKRL